MARSGPEAPRSSDLEVTGDPEDRFRQLFQTLPVGIYQTRPDGTILEANPALAEILGYDDPREIVGQDARSFYLDVEDRERWQHELAEHGIVENVHAQLERADGDSVWIEMTIRALEDDEGRTFYEGTAVDITERRQAQAALEESAARFRSLLESAPDAMLMVDEDGQVRIANHEAEILFDYDRDALTGMRIEELIPERFREDHVGQREGYMEDPQRRPMGAGLDLFALTADGEEIPVEISLSPAQTPTEALVIAAVRDIRQHKRIEGTLRVLRTMPVETESAATPNDAIEVALRIVCEATGWVLGEAWIPQDGELVHGPSWHDGGAGLDRFVEASTGVTFSPGEGLPGRTWSSREPSWVDDVSSSGCVQRRTPERAPTLGSGVGIPVPGDEGLLAVLVFFLPERQEEDDRFVETLSAVAAQLGTVVERKRVEQTLRHRTRELEVTNEELEAFTQSVSHDLQSPLRTIEGFGHLLLDRYGDEIDENGRFLVERMREAGRTMVGLIESLSMLSRISRQEMQFEPVDVTALAREILEDLASQAPERDVETHVEDGLTVEGDPGLVRILVENLLTNAWKFTRDTEDARIELGSRTTEGRAVFYVRDNGAGFRPERAKEIFEPFKRLHDEDAFEGTGIGLATVYRIVRRHGGTIEADGAPGEGAEFTFTLEEPTAELAAQA